ncbi:MAG: YqeG family HAD IIIA-type phosphatase [Oscillospiraceae bacterium]
MLFSPEFLFQRAADITPQFLKSRGIRGLILDLDNTLTTHNNPVPPPEIPAWIARLKAAGIAVMIVSNNSRVRVTPFAQQLGLDFIPRGCKPLPIGMRRAAKKMGLTRRQVAAVGDQLFTDILGAKLGGMHGIFVFPMAAEKGPVFRFKRLLEKPILRGKKLTDADCN